MDMSSKGPFLLAVATLAALALLAGAHSHHDVAMIRRSLQEVQALTEVPSSERAALMHLYNTTNGHQWNIFKPWYQGPACSWPGVSCCLPLPQLGQLPNQQLAATGFYLAHIRAMNQTKSVWQVESCEELGRVAGLTLGGAGLSGSLPLQVLDDLPALQHLDLADNPGLTGGGPKLVQLLLRARAADIQNTSLTCTGYSNETWQLESAIPPWCLPPVNRAVLSWQTLEISGGGVRCAQTTVSQSVSTVTGLPISTVLSTDAGFWLFQHCTCDGSSDSPTVQPVHFSNSDQRWHVECKQAGSSPMPRVTPKDVGMIVAVIVGGLLASLLLAVVLVRRRSVASVDVYQHLSSPPGTRPDLNPHGVTLVATDVEGSTELWEWNPGIMNEALILHDTFMRASMAACGGYEVTTEGDAFLVAWHTPVAAVRWCLMLQQGLLKLAWPEQLLTHPMCMPRPLVSVAVKASHNPGPDSTTQLVLFKGLNVRMGVASGHPTSVKPHPTTGRMQYSGLVLRLATAVADMALGGQILMDPCTFRMLHGALDKVHTQSVELELLTDHINKAMGIRSQGVLDVQDSDAGCHSQSGDPKQSADLALKSTHSFLQTAIGNDGFNMHMFHGAKQTSVAVKQSASSFLASLVDLRRSKDMRRSKEMRHLVEAVSRARTSTCSDRQASHGGSISAPLIRQQCAKTQVENPSQDTNASKYKSDASIRHNCEADLFFATGDHTGVESQEQIEQTSSVMALFTRTMMADTFLPRFANSSLANVTRAPSGGNPDIQTKPHALEAVRASFDHPHHGAAERLMVPSRLSLDVRSNYPAKSIRQSRFTQLRTSTEQTVPQWRGAPLTDSGAMPVIVSCNNAIAEDSESGACSASCRSASTTALSNKSSKHPSTGNLVLDAATEAQNAPAECVLRESGIGSSGQPGALWLFQQLYGSSIPRQSSAGLPSPFSSPSKELTSQTRVGSLNPGSHLNTTQELVCQDRFSVTSSTVVDSLSMFATKSGAGSGKLGDSRSVFKSLLRCSLAGNQQRGAGLSGIVPGVQLNPALQEEASLNELEFRPAQHQALGFKSGPSKLCSNPDFAPLENSNKQMDTGTYFQSESSSVPVLSWPQPVEMRSTSTGSASAASANVSTCVQGSSMPRWLDTSADLHGPHVASTTPAADLRSASMRAESQLMVGTSLMDTAQKRVTWGAQPSVPVQAMEDNILADGTKGEDAVDGQRLSSTAPKLAICTAADEKAVQQIRHSHARRRSVLWHEIVAGNESSLLSRIVSPRNRRSSVVIEIPGSGPDVIMSPSFTQLITKATPLGKDPTVQHVLVIDMGVHLMKSLGPALPQDLVQGLQVVQILPEALSARASYLNHVQSKRMIAPSFFDAPGANLALVPRPAGSPALQYPPVVMMFISPEHLGSVAESADQSVYDQSLSLFCQTVRSVLQEFQLYECQESQGSLMVAGARPGTVVKAALLLQLRLLSADWPEALLDLPIAEEVRNQQTGAILFRGLRAKVGIYMDSPLTIVPHATTGRADYFGVMVNRAARYMAGAVGGQTLIDKDAATEAMIEWRQAQHNRNSTLGHNSRNSALAPGVGSNRPTTQHSAVHNNSSNGDIIRHRQNTAGGSEWLLETRDTVASVMSPGQGMTPPATPLLLTSYPANILKDIANKSAYAQVCLEPGSSLQASKQDLTARQQLSSGNEPALPKRPSIILPPSSRQTSSTFGPDNAEVEVWLLDMGEFEFKGLPAAQQVMGFELASLSSRNSVLAGNAVAMSKAKCVRGGRGLVEKVNVCIQDGQ